MFLDAFQMRRNWKNRLSHEKTVPSTHPVRALLDYFSVPSQQNSSLSILLRLLCSRLREQRSAHGAISLRNTHFLLFQLFKLKTLLQQKVGISWILEQCVCFLETVYGRLTDFQRKSRKKFWNKIFYHPLDTHLDYFKKCPFWLSCLVRR